VLLANPALVDLVPGAGTDQRHPSVLDHVHPDDVVTAKAALTDLVDGSVEGTDNLVRVPVRMVDGDGQSVYTLLAASLVQTGAGEADELVVTVDDVDALVRQPSLDPAESPGEPPAESPAEPKAGPPAEDAPASADR
jgi:hypothetical protein